jgi:hypothetical protein
MSRALGLLCAWASLGALACAHPVDDTDVSAQDSPARGGAPAKAAGGGQAGKPSVAGISGATTHGGASSGGSGGVATAPAGGSDDGGADSLNAGGTTSGGTTSDGGSTNVGGDSASVDGDLVVDLKQVNTDPNDNQIRPALRIVSAASAPVALSSLELRYYFTSEVALPLTIEIYDAALTGTSGYHPVSHDAVKAQVTDISSYLSLSFTDAAGSLAMGDSITLDVAIHGPNWTGNFSEADDYSFAPDHTDFAAWDHVSLFSGQTLIWGREPP